MAKIFEYVPYEEYKPVMQRVESCISKSDWLICFLHYNFWKRN